MHAYYIWYFVIGGLLGNGFPHFIWGLSKTIARTPFGQKSKPIVSLRWGLSNFIVATLLSFWQISQHTVTGASMIILLIGFWLMVAQFGFGIKRFLNEK
jgi:hypothetical protein